MKRWIRIFSFLLAAVMMFTSSSFAYEKENTNLADGMENVTITLEGQPVNINYQIEDDYITHVKIGENVMTREGDEVFLNGRKIATITTMTVVADDTIQPRTGWIYGNGTCPDGASPSDYNQLVETKNHNITFEIEVGKITRDILLGLLVLIVPFVNKATGREVFSGVAGIILGHISAFDDGCIYATENKYKGGIPYTRKNVFKFYNDEAKDSSSYEGTATCYSSWA